MKKILLAINFLTKIPFSKLKYSKNDIGKSSTYFPIAGLVIGIILVLSNFILGRFFPGGPLINLILIFILTILTGGIHLDGLADTVDGLASKASSKEKILEIMHDSRIGAMGVLALVFTVFFKFTLLNNIPSYFMPGALIIFPVISRWCMVLAITTSNYARSEGLAKVFIENKSLKIFSTATILTLCILFFLPVLYSKMDFRPIFIMFEAAVFTLILNWYIKRKIGGITGDTLGAVNEINEILILGMLIICY